MQEDPNEHEPVQDLENIMRALSASDPMPADHEHESLRALERLMLSLSTTLDGKSTEAVAALQETLRKVDLRLVELRTEVTKQFDQICSAAVPLLNRMTGVEASAGEGVLECRREGSTVATLRIRFVGQSACLEILLPWAIQSAIQPLPGMGAVALFTSPAAPFATIVSCQELSGAKPLHDVTCTDLGNYFLRVRKEIRSVMHYFVLSMVSSPVLRGPQPHE